MADREIRVVYDRECPVCEFYCQRIDVRPAAGDLQRIDARDRSDDMDDITAMGLDIDEGMVVTIDGEHFYGSEAIHQLALLSSKKGFINWTAFHAFRFRTLSRVFYPILKACRNLLLKILGRSRINNLEIDGNDRF